MKPSVHGFTLIETIIYIALVGVIVSSMVLLSISVSEVRNKIYSAQEVQGNLRHATDIIAQRIRASTGVTIGNSTFGSDPGVLQLSMKESAKNPTIISLTADNGALQIQEGVGAAVLLTTDDVDVTNLLFTNLTDGEREHIRIQMTIAYDSDAPDVEYAYSKSITTAVSVRQ
jgi:type II secretory pathway pseudopilin PulG